MGQITPHTGTPTHTYTHAHKWKESDLEIHPCWQLAQLEMAKALGECHLNSSLNDRNTASELCRASSCPSPSPCITQQAYLIDSPLCIQSPPNTLLAHNTNNDAQQQSGRGLWGCPGHLSPHCLPFVRIPPPPPLGTPNLSVVLAAHNNQNR